MLPAIRKRLKSLTAGNKGLQDILRSMTAADEIISVETYNGKIHNTKLIIRVDRSKVTGTELPEQERYVNRAHFYNRVPISVAIPSGASYPTDNVLTAIASLNNLGCDFTEDDVEFIDGALVAKETSLGYYNAAAECTNIVNLNWYEKTDAGNTVAYGFQAWVANLIPPLVKAGQKWNLSNKGISKTLLRPGGYVSNNIYDRYIGPINEIIEGGVSKITNIENEHFQLKFIYVFKDDGIYDEERQILVNGFTKSGSFRKLLLGPHQTNNSVTVDSYPLEQLWVRYPELQSEDYLEDVQDSIFDQDFDERFPQYQPIPEQDALVIEINILYCPNPNCNPTSLSMQHFNINTVAETHLNGALTIQVVQNGATVTQIVRPTQLPPDVDLSALDMIRWFAEGQGIVFVDGGNEGFGQYRTYGRQITGSMNEGEDGVPGVLNPTSIRIMKTQGEPVETDIFEWLLEAEEGLDAETLAEARSLGLSVRSCGTQYWEGM